MGASDKEMPEAPSMTRSHSFRRRCRARFTIATPSRSRGICWENTSFMCRAGVEYVGRIVEVEAYLGTNDLASHSSRGLTGRTRDHVRPAGPRLRLPGVRHALLHERRDTARRPRLRRAGAGVEPVKNVEGSTRGPGRLCKAMHIDRRLNGHDLTSDDFLYRRSARTPNARASSRERASASTTRGIGRGGSCGSTSGAIPSSRSVRVNYRFVIIDLTEVSR